MRQAPDRGRRRRRDWAVGGTVDFDEVAADRISDLDRHRSVRAALANLLLEDPRVVRLFEGWRRQMGARAAAPRALEADDPEGGGAQVGRLAESALAFLRDELRLVDRHGRVYAWTVMLLLRTFFYDLVARAFRRRIVVEERFTAAPFFAAEDRTDIEALERWLGVETWIGEDGGRSDQGRRPKHAGETLKLWARWFYRVRVRGDSIRSVAREYADAHNAHPADGGRIGPDQRATVRDGVEEVERLLELSAYRIV